jgi:hypothetical protein
MTFTLSFYTVADSIMTIQPVVLTKDTRDSSTNQVVHLTDTSNSTSGGYTRHEYTFSMNAINPTNTVLSVSINILNFTGTARFTGVQLEEGSVATPFEKIDSALELMRCQRYYQSYKDSTEPFTLFLAGTTTARGSFTLPTIMRTKPSITYYSLDGTANQITRDSINHEPISTGSISGKSNSIRVDANLTASGLKFDMLAKLDAEL